MHSRGAERVGINVHDVCLIRGKVPESVEIRKRAGDVSKGGAICSPNRSPSRMTVYLLTVTLSLVENVNFLPIAEEHL